MKISDLIHQLRAVLSTLPSHPRSPYSTPIALFTIYAENKLMFLLEKMRADDLAKVTFQEDIVIIEEEKTAADPEETISQENIAAIMALQSELFGVIHPSDHIPPHAPQSRLTSLFLTLAQALENVTGKSRYELLLPDVKIIDYETSTTSLRDHGLQLTDFVLSDDGEAIIEVATCLDFAEEDGVLKHTRLFDGQPRALSETEASRVIHHSKESKAYWEAIQAVLNITVRGDSYGAALRRLCDNLRRGGVDGDRGGKEFVAGPDADVGISLFFAWYDKLTPDEQKDLANYGGRTRLGELFGRMGNPLDPKFQDGRYCVQIIAGMIETILKENPKLDSLYPQSKIPLQHGLLAHMKEHVAETRDALKKAMQSPHDYRVTSTYGREAEKQFAARVRQLPDLHAHTDQLPMSFPMQRPIHADEEKNNDPPNPSVGQIAEQHFASGNAGHEEAAPHHQSGTHGRGFFSQRPRGMGMAHRLMNPAERERRERESRLAATADRLFRETAEALQAYGLTEAYLRDNFRTPEGFFGETEKELLIYLVTGIPPEADPCLPSSYLLLLREEQKLTPAQAILEINHLSTLKKMALEQLYAYGLRGDHLRAFQPSGEGNSFLSVHTFALVYLIRDKRPPLAPEEAMQRLNGLDYRQAATIHIEGQHTMRQERQSARFGR